MSSGKITFSHVCPECGKIANTYQELYKKFGFRNMDKNSMRNQSWCRDCRKQSVKK